MTPERKAELQAWRSEGDPTKGVPDLAAWFLQLPGNLDEMIDEIDRLEGLVREAHRGWISVDAMGATAGFSVGDKARCERYVEAGVRNGVQYRYGGSCHIGCPTPQDRLHWRATWDEAVADHAAHVEAILRGNT